MLGSGSTVHPDPQQYLPEIRLTDEQRDLQATIWHSNPLLLYNCIVYSYLYGQAAGCDECGEGEPGCVQPEPGGGQAAGGGAGHLTQALVAHPPTSLVQPDIHNILKISLCIPGRVFNSDTKLLITNQ